MAIDLPTIEPREVHFVPASQQVSFSYPNRACDVSIAGERLGALLVSYLVRARIPLPRYREKTVRVEAGAIVILCTTHYNDPPPVQ